MLHGLCLRHEGGLLTRKISNHRTQL
jgi:hypothetical protein